MTHKPRITLGIETSCDETGAAIYHETKGILSNALYSQIELHKLFGGVMPEVASRTQLEKINPIITAALNDAAITIDDVDVIAVTSKPGLPGSLLVGVCFAKALAWTTNKKLIGINHLEGHAFSSFLQYDVPFPHICITASGGHTSIYLITGFGEYTVLGQTVDDAAGEAFDKIAKLLNLPYPGGPEIEKRASLAQFKDYFSYPRHNPLTLDFSFSGLKTAVLYDLVKRKYYDLGQKKLLTDSLSPAEIEKLQNQVASSLLVCISDIFTHKIETALTQHPEVKAVTFVGGVACNKFIRSELQKTCDARQLPLYIPSPKYCTDNGAMIALVGNYKAAQGKYSSWDLDILE
jgi:putative glycoprotease GCP